MRKLQVFLIGVFLAFSFTSCGDISEVSNSYYVDNLVNSKSQVESNTYIESESENMETEVEKITEPEMIYVDISSGENFSDGVAWVYFEDPSNEYESTPAIMTKDGEIIITDDLREIDAIGARFSGGYSYINKGDNWYIVDKNGKITAKSPDDETIYSIVTGGNGVYLVCQKIESLEENVVKYGFITAEGNWISELSANSPIGNNCTQYYYYGEHNFLSFEAGAYHGDSYSYLTVYTYNADNNTSNKFGYGDLYIYDQSKKKFESYNDNIIMVYEDDDMCVDVYDFSNHTFKDYRWIKLDYLRQNDNIIFMSENYNGGKITDGEFWTYEGELLLKYDKYPLWVPDTPGFYEFNDGVAAVILVGADDNYYLGFIDLNGEFLFEPYKLYQSDYGYIYHSACSNNAVYAKIYIEDEEVYRDYLVNSEGTLVSMPESFGEQGHTLGDVYYGNINFAEGYDWNHTTKYYIGTDGSIIYPHIFIE